MDFVAGKFRQLTGVKGEAEYPASWRGKAVDAIFLGERSLKEIGREIKKSI